MNLYIRTLISLLFLVSYTGIHASGTIDYFEVILGSDSASVGQALDITISAIDKDGAIVTDYTSDILVFSESDAEAEFPNALSENSYSFTLADEGSVKFENAVKFKNKGIQDIFVYDLNDDSVLGIAEVTIIEKEVVENVDIMLLSPENGITHSKNTITVSGSSSKNHQIQIILNDEEKFFTTTNTDGIFEKQLENLSEGLNTIEAMILNADNEVIGESQKVEFRINASKPEMKSIIISPAGEVEAESVISIQVVANAGLSSVQILLDDIISTLSEEKDGIYLGDARAPTQKGTYPIDVILKNEFAHETNVREAASLIVTPLPDLLAPNPPEQPTEMTQEEVTETTQEEVNEGDKKEIYEPDLTIRNIDVVELKTKSVITWDALEDAVSYNIYKKTEDDIILIDNIYEAQYEIEITGDTIVYEDFAIKAIGKNEDTGEIPRGDLSEMTKVKTGPEMYIFLGLIALFLATGIGFMRKNI